MSSASLRRAMQSGVNRVWPARVSRCARDWTRSRLEPGRTTPYEWACGGGTSGSRSTLSAKASVCGIAFSGGEPSSGDAAAVGETEAHETHEHA